MRFRVTSGRWALTMFTTRRIWERQCHVGHRFGGDNLVSAVRHPELRYVVDLCRQSIGSTIRSEVHGEETRAS
jgi:hypothetical protein